MDDEWGSKYQTVFVLHGIPLTNTCNHSLSTHYMFALLVASLLVPWVWKYASVQQAETARRYASPSKMRRDYARTAQFIERKRLNAQSVCSAVAVSDAVADTTESIPSEEEPSESSSVTSGADSSDYVGDDERGMGVGVPNQIGITGNCAKVLPNRFNLLIKSVVDSRTPFGRFAKEYVLGSSVEYNGRIRDIFPIPRVKCILKYVDGPLSDELQVTLCNLVNLCLAGMSYLDGQSSRCIQNAPTILQTAVHERIARKTYRMYQRLSAVDKPITTFGSFVGRDGLERYPELKANLVDCLPHAGLVDPLPFLPCEAKDILTDPEKLFPNGVEMNKRQSKFTGGDRSEYVKLVVRHLEAGQCGLQRDIVSSASVFAVAKSGKQAQRAIWNGQQLSTCAVPPPKPPKLVSPTALVRLEASRERPIWTSKKDGSCFFDQLQLPMQLRSFMGRPSVKIAELIEIGGLTYEQVLLYLASNQDLPHASSVFPVNRTWAMGFSCSSFVAQCVMTGCCERAGLCAESFLADERQVPSNMESVVGVATDDVMHFTTLGPTTSEAFMEALGNTFDGAHVISNDAKEVVGKLDATCVGIDISQGIFLGPSASKLLSFLDAATDLFKNPVCTPLEMASFLGTLQWFDLLNRWLLSCLMDIYGFIRSDGQETMQEVTAAALGEIMLNTALLPCLEVDLRRPWLDHIVATDASPSYGFGVVVAPTTKHTARLIGKASLDPETVVRLTRDVDDPLEKPRAGKTLRLQLRQRSFRTVLSLKAEHIEHSGGMEAHGFALGVRWIARDHHRHGSRAVVLVDAKTVRGAICKGRTSAPTLRRAMRKSAATILAADLQVYTAYTPSESNAADWPSRGLRRRQELSRHKNRTIRGDGKSVKCKPTKLELYDAKHERMQKWLGQWCIDHGIGLSSDCAESVGSTSL